MGGKKLRKMMGERAEIARFIIGYMIFFFKKKIKKKKKKKSRKSEKNEKKMKKRR
jgi:large-conductance mechanosensitive channel